MTAEPMARRAGPEHASAVRRLDGARDEQSRLQGRAEIRNPDAESSMTMLALTDRTGCLPFFLRARHPEGQARSTSARQPTPPNTRTELEPSDDRDAARAGCPPRATCRST